MKWNLRSLGLLDSASKLNVFFFGLDREQVNLIYIWGGGVGHSLASDAKNNKKCLCSSFNHTALIKKNFWVGQMCRLYTINPLMHGRFYNPKQECVRSGKTKMLFFYFIWASATKSWEK